MNWLKSGPELKMPDLKVPDFLVDLYWDLRDRHLLPLVGLVIVAIVAVPFLLGGGSEEEPAPAVTGASGVPSPESGGAKLTVVEAKPGLRDYRKRLRAQAHTDPFEQRYTSPVLKGTKLGGGGDEGSSTPSSTTTTTTRSSSSTTKITKTEKDSDGTTTTEVVTETEGGAKPGGPDEGGLTLFAFAVDLKIVHTETKADGSKEREPEVRRRVVPPAALPSAKTQVATYMGISPKTQQPLFLISDTVSALFGEATCLSGAEKCQLIEVAAGLPITFVYGTSSDRYKITVLKVEPVVTGRG